MANLVTSHLAGDGAGPLAGVGTGRRADPVPTAM